MATSAQSRAPSSLKQLQRQIARHCTGSQTTTAIPGLTLLRSDGVMTSPVQAIYTPMVCLIAQGRKQVMLGGETLEYDAAKYLVSSVDLPVSGRITEATPSRPYLALSLSLDADALASLLLQIRSAQAPGGAFVRPAPVPRALAITSAMPDLLDAFVRLLRLLDRPAEVEALAPLIVREILFRLLTGAHAPMLRQIALRESRTQQVVRAINWIRRNYARPLHIGDLVSVAHMSPPSLYRHFKAVTAMSPLQYQKQIRLQEARRQLVSQQQDAAAVAFAVGYGSPSQFSREYRRLFGTSPRQDATRLMREEAAATAEAALVKATTEAAA